MSNMEGTVFGFIDLFWSDYVNELDNLSISYMDMAVLTKQLSYEKVSDEKVSDEKVSDEKVSDEKVSDEKVSDEKVSDEKVSDEKVSDEIKIQVRLEEKFRNAESVSDSTFLGSDYTSTYGNDKENPVRIYQCTVKNCTITKHSPRVIEPPPHCSKHTNVEMKLT